MSQQQLIQEPAAADSGDFWARVHRGPLKHEMIALLELIHDYQEIAQQWLRYEPDGEYHGAHQEATRIQLKMSTAKFETVRDQLLQMPGTILIRTPSGRLALTW